MSEPLTPEQLAAVNCTDLDILVEAGAGSGKTKTTVDRYSRLITEDPDPSRILVFTFTDKAATELRERVRKSRDETGGPDQGQAFSMSSAWVGTFHAICSRILRAHPIQADIDPAFAVLDDVQAARLKEAAYDRALGDFLTGSDEEELIARFTPSHLRSGVSNAYEQLRARGQIVPVLPEPEPPDVSKALARVLLISGESVDIPRLQAKTVAQIQGMTDFLASVDHRSLTFAAFEDARLTSGSAKLKPLQAAVADLRGALAATEFGEEYRQALARLFRLYAEEYAKRKQAAALLDYEDLQLVTLKLLGDNPDVAARYREQFDEIMVDEFQDTNQLQLNLIAALRGEDTTLFTVGDEMQAIYGFRHADVRLFRTRRNDPRVTVLRLSANFRSQAPVIGSVNLIGEKLDQAVSVDLGPLERAERHHFAPLRVGLETKPAGGDEIEMLFTHPEGWLPQDLGPLSPKIDPQQHNGPVTDGQYQAEALLLAQHLSDAVRLKSVKPGDIAILFRAKSRIWIFVEALKQVGLRPYVVGGTGFWESREGVDLKSLLAVIANPLDDDSLLGSLAGPACGLGTDSLLLLRQAAGSGPLWRALESVAREEHPGFTEANLSRAGNFVSTITSLRSRASMMPLGELVESAVSGTGYDLANLVRDPGGAGLANIRRVASLASEFEASERRDLRGFLEWIEISAQLDSEAAVATEDEDGDAVQLMTVHKSKGLEFDMVCVADLGRQRKNRSETVFWLGQTDGESEALDFGLRLPMPDGTNIDLFDWTRLAEASAREAADEELRLFHVALTRARRRLVISGICDLNLEQEPGLSASTAKRLSSVLDIDLDSPEAVRVPAAEPGVELARAPVDSTISIWRNEANEDQADYLRRSQKIVLAPAGALSGRPPIDRPAAAAHPDVPLSFTALNEFRECPARFLASRVLRMDPPEEPLWTLDPEDSSPNLRQASTAFGSAIHELFERCAERRWVAPTMAEIETKLKSQGIAVADGVLPERARSMINGFLASSLGQRVRTERCDIEIPLLVRIRDVTIRGFADLVTRESDPPLILDYKSNRLDGTTAAQKMKTYELQRDLYGLAVAQAMDTDRVDTAFVFLEDPEAPVVSEYGVEELNEARRELEGIVDAITSGNFFSPVEGITDGPCRDCWACAKLERQIEAATTA